MSCCGGGSRRTGGCCGGGARGGDSCAPAPAPAPFPAEETKAQVRENYGKIAEKAPIKPSDSATFVAKEFGYSDEQLASLPDGANMGLQCGNPTALASLKAGEYVLDLGSGGGIDVFLASKQVGPTGKAYGLDMTESMIKRARAAAARGGYTNVEFVKGEMEKMPLPDNHFDCIISNCVVNLSPDKPAVFREMFRVLKPGGRVAISDMALKKPLPEELRKSVALYSGCIGGAIPITDYANQVRAAGFVDVVVEDKHKDLNVYADRAKAQGRTAPPAEASCSCCGNDADGTLDPEVLKMFEKYDANEYAASVNFLARKPQ